MTLDVGNEQGVGIFLDLIKNDTIDNHGRSINDILPDIVLINQPQLD
jgi:hypothetical protein